MSNRRSARQQQNKPNRKGVSFSSATKDAMDKLTDSLGEIMHPESRPENKGPSEESLLTGTGKRVKATTASNDSTSQLLPGSVPVDMIVDPSSTTQKPPNTESSETPVELVVVESTPTSSQNEAEQLIERAKERAIMLAAAQDVLLPKQSASQHASITTEPLITVDGS